LDSRSRPSVWYPTQQTSTQLTQIKTRERADVSSLQVLTRFFAAMPIRSHLGGQHFDPETIRLMGIAFEMALVSLQRTDGSINPTRAAVAQKIIELAKAGERDPERLCEGALKATQPVIPVLISDPSPLPPHASPPVLPDS
jgi:hypothetical protein